MYEVDISPQPMLSVDLFLTEVLQQVGAAVFISVSTARAYAPAVTALRNATVQAVLAASSGSALASLAGGLSSPIVLAPKATMTGVAPAPASDSNVVVVAVVATAIHVAKPVEATATAGSVDVTAPISAGTLSTPVSVIISETVLTAGGGAYRYLNSGTGAQNGTTHHVIGHSSAATAPSSGCALNFVPAAGSLLVVFVGAQMSHTSDGAGAGSGWTRQQNPSNSGTCSLFTKTAVGNDFISILHNGSNFPMNWAMYELPQGSTYTNSSSLSNNTDVFQDVTSLPGTDQLVIGAYSRGSNAGGLTGGSTCSAPWVEDADLFAQGPASASNYFYVLHAQAQAGTTATPVFTYGVTGTVVSDRQKIVAAFDVSGGPIRSNMFAIPPVVSGT